MTVLHEFAAGLEGEFLPPAEEVILFLLEHSASPYVVTHGKSFLQRLIEQQFDVGNGFPMLLRTLLRGHIDVNWTNKQGELLVLAEQPIRWV